MFEELRKKSTLGESLEALVYLIKASPIRVIFYCGAVPFAIAWVVRDTILTAFALQSYLVTSGVFLEGPFRSQKPNINQWWFWKLMLLGGILIHPILLACMWYLDNTYPSLVNGTATLFLFVLVASVVESIILGKIVNRFRPHPPALEGF